MSDGRENTNTTFTRRKPLAPGEFFERLGLPNPYAPLRPYVDRVPAPPPPNPISRTRRLSRVVLSLFHL
jgi:hypothetical protein